MVINFGNTPSKRWAHSGDGWDFPAVGRYHRYLRIAETSTPWKRSCQYKRTRGQSMREERRLRRTQEKREWQKQMEEL